MTMGEPSGATKEIYDNAETAIAAITDFERLLSGDGCPLPDWLTFKYKLRCKSMVTELLRMSDEWARGLEELRPQHDRRRDLHRGIGGIDGQPENQC